MDNTETPNYYAIIPANVRYSKELSAQEKLLYGEITALANAKGYCFASNNYFAELYNLSKETISRQISKLQKHGFIKIQIKYAENSKEIIERRVFINVINTPIDKNVNTPIDKNVNTPIDKNVNTPIDKNVNTPIDKNVKDNNTSINNISPSSPSVKEEKKKKEDGQDTTDQTIQAYMDLIKENISYNDLAVSRKYDLKLIDEFIYIILDVIMTKSKTVRIDSENKPRTLVINQLMKLTYSDIEHAIGQFKAYTKPIAKKKQFILTMLYNCKMELDSHYTNMYESDKYN